jgi:hypothetical protein
MQTSIHAEGFRSLREGETVEFEIEAGSDGRAKAVNVTGPEGSTPMVREKIIAHSQTSDTCGQAVNKGHEFSRGQHRRGQVLE